MAWNQLHLTISEIAIDLKTTLRSTYEWLPCNVKRYYLFANLYCFYISSFPYY